MRNHDHVRFTMVVSDYVYGVYRDAVDDSHGDILADGWWYGLVGRRLESDHWGLEASERSFLDKQVGAIMMEDADGRVYVRYFTDRDVMDEEWGFVKSGEIAFKIEKGEDWRDYACESDTVWLRDKDGSYTKLED